MKTNFSSKNSNNWVDQNEGQVDGFVVVVSGSTPYRCEYVILKSKHYDPIWQSKIWPKCLTFLGYIFHVTKFCHSLAHFYAIRQIVIVVNNLKTLKI